MGNSNCYTTQYDVEKKKFYDHWGTKAGKVLSWYRNVANVPAERKYLYAWELATATRWFAIVSTILNDETVVTEDNIVDVVKVLKKIYPDVTGSDDRDYVRSVIGLFNTEVNTETVHKTNVPILKLTLKDVFFDAKGNAFIDSSKASTFLGQDVVTKDKKKTMRWVETAEDGITRILQEEGRSQIIIFFGETPLDDPSPEEEINFKKPILEFGLTDVATGKHFLCSAPSASGTRTADFPFVEADTPEQVFDIWLKITGFSTMEELLGNLGSIVE